MRLLLAGVLILCSCSNSVDVLYKEKVVELTKEVKNFSEVIGDKPCYEELHKLEAAVNTKLEEIGSDKVKIGDVFFIGVAYKESIQKTIDKYYSFDYDEVNNGILYNRCVNLMRRYEELANKWYLSWREP